MKSLLIAVVMLVLSVGVMAQDLHAHKCLETIPSTYQGRSVWLTWRISECKGRVTSPRPGNRQRVAIEDVVRKNILVTDDMVVIHPREQHAELTGCWGCGSDGAYVLIIGSDGKPQWERAVRGNAEVEVRTTVNPPTKRQRKYAHAQTQKAVVETPCKQEASLSGVDFPRLLVRSSPAPAANVRYANSK